MLPKEVSACLFFLLLMLSFALSVTDVSDEEHTNKAFPITVLVVNSLIILLLLLSVLGNNFAKSLINVGDGTPAMLLFTLVLVLSFVLSIVDVSDEDKENRSLPVIVLVVNSLVILMVVFQMVFNYMKRGTPLTA